MNEEARLRSEELPVTEFRALVISRRLTAAMISPALQPKDMFLIEL
jgi:hypothetical protein